MLRPVDLRGQVIDAVADLDRRGAGVGLISVAGPFFLRSQLQTGHQLGYGVEVFVAVELDGFRQLGGRRDCLRDGELGHRTHHLCDELFQLKSHWISFREGLRQLSRCRGVSSILRRKVHRG